MHHQSLTAQIAFKGKKPTQTFEPAFFSEIPYSNVTQINYLRDLEEKKKNIDFPIFQFEKDFGEEAQVNEFDMLANTLYKKIMQNGYIQQKKAPSKKKKKTKNPFEYDYEDVWINDEEAITVKKNIYVKLENFKCLNQGVDQFYKSELYKSNIAQIQQMSKKRTNQISMDAQQLQEIKKKIKQNISITHSKIKQEIDIEKPTTFLSQTEENQINDHHQSEAIVKFQSQIVQKTVEINKNSQVLKVQQHEIHIENSQKVQKDSKTKEPQNTVCQQEKGSKKQKKNSLKAKNVVPKKKKEKNTQPNLLIEQGPQNGEIKIQKQSGKQGSIQNSLQFKQVKLDKSPNDLKEDQSSNNKEIQNKESHKKQNGRPFEQQDINKVDQS